MAEVNFGYNGSENFAPGKRFGAFPAGSIGYISSEEAFMKKQKVVDYLKFRASVAWSEMTILEITASYSCRTLMM